MRSRASPAGADDYVLKPFSLAVRAGRARVDAHLARDQCQQVHAEVRFDGDLAVDYRTRTVTVAGAPVELTRREFDIVAFLSKHPGQVFDRDRIHERVGGWENESDLAGGHGAHTPHTQEAGCGRHSSTTPWKLVWGTATTGWRVCSSARTAAASRACARTVA